MSKQTINVGSAANDGTGTPTRTAFQYVNANFTELYNAVGGSNGAIPSAIPVGSGGTGATTAAVARTNLGLGSAATLTATTSNIDAVPGRVLKVGDFGVGSIGGPAMTDMSLQRESGFYYTAAPNTITNDTGNAPSGYAHIINLSRTGNGSQSLQIGATAASNPILKYRGMVGGAWGNWHDVLSTWNTIKDANGFIKAASPIVQLFTNKIELNEEAQQQNIEFEKVATGEYLIKGSTGFAQESWYVEMPKDANGNVLVAVVYEQLENKDISVKTYKKKFDLETASIVADLTQPVDIPEGRWIDLRLQELPQEVIDES